MANLPVNHSNPLYQSVGGIMREELRKEFLGIPTTQPPSAHLPWNSTYNLPNSSSLRAQQKIMSHLSLNHSNTPCHPDGRVMREEPRKEVHGLPATEPPSANAPWNSTNNIPNLSSVNSQHNNGYTTMAPTHTIVRPVPINISYNSYLTGQNQMLQPTNPYFRPQYMPPVYPPFYIPTYFNLGQSVQQNQNVQMMPLAQENPTVISKQQDGSDTDEHVLNTRQVNDESQESGRTDTPNEKDQENPTVTSKQQDGSGIDVDTLNTNQVNEESEESRDIDTPYEKDTPSTPTRSITTDSPQSTSSPINTDSEASSLLDESHSNGSISSTPNISKMNQVTNEFQESRCIETPYERDPPNTPTRSITIDSPQTTSSSIHTEAEAIALSDEPLFDESITNTKNISKMKQGTNEFQESRQIEAPYEKDPPNTPTRSITIDSPPKTPSSVHTTDEAMALLNKLLSNDNISNTTNISKTMQMAEKFLKSRYIETSNEKDTPSTPTGSIIDFLQKTSSLTYTGAETSTLLDEMFSGGNISSTSNISKMKQVINEVQKSRHIETLYEKDPPNTSSRSITIDSPSKTLSSVYTNDEAMALSDELFPEGSISSTPNILKKQVTNEFPESRHIETLFEKDPPNTPTRSITIDSPQSTSPSIYTYVEAIALLDKPLSDGTILNTTNIAMEIKQWLRTRIRSVKVSQAMFSNNILNRTQGTLSVLLNEPILWEELAPAGKKTWLRMHNWILLSNEQREEIMKLNLQGDKDKERSIETVSLSEENSTPLVSSIRKRNLAEEVEANIEDVRSSEENCVPIDKTAKKRKTPVEEEASIAAVILSEENPNSKNETTKRGRAPEVEHASIETASLIEENLVPMDKTAKRRKIPEEKETSNEVVSSPEVFHISMDNTIKKRNSLEVKKSSIKAVSSSKVNCAPKNETTKREKAPEVEEASIETDSSPEIIYIPMDNTIKTSKLSEEKKASAGAASSSKQNCVHIDKTAKKRKTPKVEKASNEAVSSPDVIYIPTKNTIKKRKLPEKKQANIEAVSSPEIIYIPMDKTIDKRKRPVERVASIEVVRSSEVHVNPKDETAKQRKTPEGEEAINSNSSTIRAKTTGNIIERWPQDSTKQYTNDDSKRPNFSSSFLCSLACLNSPNGKVTVLNVYSFILHHWQYYRFCEPIWKNSIRHALANLKRFGKEEGTDGINFYFLHKPEDVKFTYDHLCFMKEDPRGKEFYIRMLEGKLGLPRQFFYYIIDKAPQFAGPENSALFYHLISNRNIPTVYSSLFQQYHQEHNGKEPKFEEKYVTFTTKMLNLENIESFGINCGEDEEKLLSAEELNLFGMNIEKYYGLQERYKMMKDEDWTTPPMSFWLL